MRFLNRVLIGAAVVQVLCAACVAQDRFEPGTGDAGDIGGYHQMLQFVLKPAYADDVVVRALLLPSFQVESAVGLRRKADGWVVFVVTAKQQVWGAVNLAMLEQGAIQNVTEGNNDKEIAQFRKRYPKGFHGIATDYLEQPVSAADADTLLATFRAVISSARTPDHPSMGCDGEIYIVSAKDAQGHEQSANTWSPRETTLSGRVVALIEELSRLAYGKAETASVVAHAKKICEDLLALSAGAPKNTVSGASPEQKH